MYVYDPETNGIISFASGAEELAEAFAGQMELVVTTSTVPYYLVTKFNEFMTSDRGLKFLDGYARTAVDEHGESSKIQAIKAVRQMTYDATLGALSVGLKEAKDAVDREVARRVATREAGNPAKLVPVGSLVYYHGTMDEHHGYYTIDANDMTAPNDRPYSLRGVPAKSALYYVARKSFTVHEEAR